MIRATTQMYFTYSIKNNPGLSTKHEEALGLKMSNRQNAAPLVEPLKPL